MRLGHPIGSARAQRTRRFRARLSVVLLAVPFLVAGPLAVPTPVRAAGTPVYPDLKTLPPREIRFDRTDVSYNLDGLPSSMHNVVRFSNTVWNAGAGVLELRAHVGAGNTPGTAYQRLYNSDGSFTDYNVGQIYFHAAHNHWHYDGWGEYELWTKANYDAWIASGRTIAKTYIAGAKSTACAEDEEFIATISGMHYPGTYDPSRCYPDSNNNIVEGLATGWGDTYDYYRPAQWFDLGQGSLASGSYVIRSVADPNNQLYESAGKASSSVEGEPSNEATTTFAVQGGVILDTDPPTGTVGINNIATSTATPNVTVQVIGRDDVSVVDQFRVSNNGSQWATFSYTTTGSFATSISWNLTNATYGGNSSAGIKTVYVQFHDSSGKWGPNQIDTINLTTGTQSSPYGQAILGDGPAGYWRLDEASGTAATDATGGGQTGTYVGGPTLGATGLLAAESADRAVVFNGSNTYVNVPSTGALSPSNALSLEAWIKPTGFPATGSYTSVLTKAEAYSLEFNGSRLEFTIMQNGVRQRLLAPVGAIVAGQTYHVVGTYDGANQRLYLNGAQVVTQALTGGASITANALTIGSWGSSEVFQGTIDEPAVYATTLSATRVLAHYTAGAGSQSGTPAAPSSLVATAQFDTIINISWTDNATNETGYVVERDTTGTFSAPITTSLAANTTSYSSTGLTAGTKYYYRVKAVNGAVSSGYSNVASATTSGGVGPAAPTALVATAQSTTAIGLTWTDNSIDESNFVVERDSTPSFTAPVTVSLPPGTTSYTSSGLAVSTTYYYRVKATNPSGGSPYTNTANATTLATGPTGYAAAVMTDTPAGYWRLGETSGTVAADLTGTNPGTYLNGVAIGSASLLAGDTANKSATFDGVNDSVSVPNSASLTPTAVTLEAWIKPSAIPAAGSFASIITKAEAYSLQFNGTQLEFTIIQGGVRQRLKAATGAIAAGQMYFIAGTYDGTTQRLYINFAQVASQPLTGAIGPASNAVTIGSWGSAEYFKGTLDDVAVYGHAVAAARLSAHYSAGVGSGSGLPPAAPSGLIATAASSAGINLTWTDNATNESGFVLERAPTSAFATITTIPLGSNLTSYADSGLAASTTYYYRIRATNPQGDSVNSNTANATTSAPVVPAAPTSLVATAQSSTAIALTWLDNATNESAYVVERASSAAFTAPVAVSLPAGTTSYTSSGLTASTTYYYRVKAMNGATSSAYSNAANATTTGAAAPPAAPTGLTATVQSTTAINLAWTDNATTETAYVLERDSSASFPSPVVRNLAANATSYADTGLGASTLYYYRVRATNASGPSANSNVVSATTQAAGASAYQTGILADTPVSYWRLGEASGTVAADLRGANQATYANSPTLGAASLLTGDTANKAVTFDGVNDTVSVANSGSLALTSTVSLEAWIKPSALPAAGAFASVVTRPEAYSLQFNGPRLEFTIIQAGVRKRLQAAVGAIVVGQTYHVVGTYDGTTQRLYINGALAVSAALSGAIGSTSNALSIGSWGSGEYFKGTIDDAAVYSSVLSATKVANHYALGTGSAATTVTLASYTISRPTVATTFSCSIHELTANLLPLGPSHAATAHADEDDHPAPIASTGSSTAVVAAISRLVPPEMFIGGAAAAPRRVEESGLPIKREETI